MKLELDQNLECRMNPDLQIIETISRRSFKLCVSGDSHIMNLPEIPRVRQMNMSVSNRAWSPIVSGNGIWYWYNQNRDTNRFRLVIPVMTMVTTGMVIEVTCFQC